MLSIGVRSPTVKSGSDEHEGPVGRNVPSLWWCGVSGAIGCWKRLVGVIARYLALGDLLCGLFLRSEIFGRDADGGNGGGGGGGSITP